MPSRFVRLSLTALALATLACNTLLAPFAERARPTPLVAPASATSALTLQPRPSRTPQPIVTVTAEPSLTALPVSAGGVRACAYVPGISTPASIMLNARAATPTPSLLPALPTNTPVGAQMTTRQLRVYQTLWDTVWAEYVYPDFNGYDWKAIGAKYKALVEAGLTDEDFYQAMDLMLAELGDEHSRFDSPEAVAMAEAEFEGRIDYVGVGILVSAVPEAARGVIILTFPDSPAAEAGLGPHDSILAVNGEMLLDAAGDRLDQIRGPEGTTVMLTVQRPGESPFDLTLTRQRITGPLPIDYCLIPGTRLAYIFLPGLNDSTIPDQMREALEALTAAGPLDGLILDNRQNGGGESTVLEAVLGFFMHGTVGHFVSPINSRPLTIRAEDVGGSQAAPLVVLVDEETASFGEVLSGVLQAMDQAQIVGQTTPGNVEILWGYGFEDGSRAWIAHETFQPLRQPNGIWEETGIVPDVHTPTRWDLFTEATDPALAVAVELLTTDN